MTKSKKRDKGVVLRFSEHERKRIDELESDLDALFRLPLAEFTGARNALAAQLKKSGRGAEAARVKALAKPSVSAWAVNQLYWNHRTAFDQLIASGERFQKAQTSRSSGKAADMREALEARRAAITQLSDLATSLLRDADQNPSTGVPGGNGVGIDGNSRKRRPAVAGHAGCQLWLGTGERRRNDRDDFSGLFQSIDRHYICAQTLQVTCDLLPQKSLILHDQQAQTC